MSRKNNGGYKKKNVQRGYKPKKYAKAPQYTTWGSVKYLAKKAYNGVQFVKGLINVEKHFHDTGITTSPSTSGYVLPLNDIENGDAQGNRTGNSILAKHITVRGSVALGNSATASRIRMVLVQDIQAIDGANPTVTDILQTASVDSFMKMENTDRFFTLMDETYEVCNTGERIRDIYRYIPLNFHIKFSGTGSGYWDMNSLFLLVISNEPTNLPYFNVNTRLAFYDN